MGAGALIVVLHLIVWDSGTGEFLGSVDREYEAAFSITPLDRIELCRTEGVRTAAAAVDFFKRGNPQYDPRTGGIVNVQHPDAFANVDCQWERKVTRL